MPPIRVLIVDDSVVIRRVLSEALTSDPAIQLVGTASDGKIALARISQLKPDLITLDVEMPNMSGLETIAETCLFRSPPQLAALDKVILPDLITTRSKIGLRKLRIWSAGCSTGEES